MKKIAIFFLFFPLPLFALSEPWSGNTTTPPHEGDTYLISSAEHLAWVAQQSQNESFDGKTIRLLDDIDLGGNLPVPPSWLPIGSMAHPFQGTLDGNNHVIYHFAILNTFPVSAGLIAETGNNAEVRNIGIAQGLIITKLTNNVGSLVGINRGHLHHVFNMTEIRANGGDNVGGLVGVNEGTIEFAYNTGIVTTANDFIGGLVGVNKANGFLNQCYNIGYCAGAGHVGAVYGKNEADPLQLTCVYYDQQMTCMNASGNGAADNARYEIKYTSTFLSNNGNPFKGLSEWKTTQNNLFCYPMLVCFNDHEAALASANAIILDAENQPIERAEAIATPKEGNKPRKEFSLRSLKDAVWFSPDEAIIKIKDQQTAEVFRPCGDQEVVLQVSVGNAHKDIYTKVKGYDAFDVGIVNGDQFVCWKQKKVYFPALNKGQEASEPRGGKNDEQDKEEYCYQYRIIRDTIWLDNMGEHFEPIDTFYLTQKEYEKWEIPTDVPGEYSFRREVHDYQCQITYKESPGRIHVSVGQEFDPGELYEKPDTLYGVPQTLTIKSKREASGGGEELVYTWKMVKYKVNYATGQATQVDAKDPLYIDGELVSTASFLFEFTGEGEYVFTRTAEEKTCKTKAASKNSHRVVVFEEFTPGAIVSQDFELCNPSSTATIGEKEPAKGGSGQYEYRWFCNSVLLENCTSATLKLTNVPLESGGYYELVRETKDKLRGDEWLPSEGTVTVKVRRPIEPGSIQPADTKNCLVAGNTQEVHLVVNNKNAASGAEGFQYRWDIYSGEDNPTLVGTIDQNAVSLDATIKLNDFHLSVPATIQVKRSVQSTECTGEWKTSENVAIWRIGRDETKSKTVTICESELPYHGTYTYLDGHTSQYTLTQDGESVVMHDQTAQGCALDVTIKCKTSKAPTVEVSPIMSVCQTASTLKIDFTILQGTPDRYDLIFSEEAEAQGFVSQTNKAIPSSGTIEVPIPAGLKLGNYQFSILFYVSSATTEGCRGVAQTIPFSFDMAGYVHRKGNDVVFVDNSGNNEESGLTFVTYQWYRNGEPIEGGTGQYYYEDNGLDGFYYVVMTVSDGTVYHSCEYEMRPMTPIEDIGADGISGHKILHNGMLMIIVGEKMYNMLGQEVQQ